MTLKSIVPVPAVFRRAGIFECKLFVTSVQQIYRNVLKGVHYFRKDEACTYIDYNDKSFDINYCAKGWVYEFFLFFSAV